MDKNSDDKTQKARLAGIFVMIPFILGIPPVLGWYIGSWLDQKLGTEPYMMFLWILLGFASGIREIVRLIKKFGT